MDEEKKERLPLWLYPRTTKLMDGSLKEDNCKSRSEFIEKAVLFYHGYIMAQNAQNYLPLSLSNAITGTVQTSENRVARLLFKLSVEMCMMMHILAETSELPDGYLDKLRGKCVKEVKKSVGAVRLDNAVQTHDEFCEE